MKIHLTTMTTCRKEIKMGKGSRRRPAQIPDWLFIINWQLATGEIDEKQYVRLRKELEATNKKEKRHGYH